jgi:hypothetical protein
LIVNQKKNASFRSTLEYVLGKEKSTLIDTNMGGETPRQLAAEFAAARRLRPNLKRACGHIIISIPHRNADHLKGEYHEHLNNEQYVAIAQSWLKHMEFRGEGLHDSQYLIARHHDTDHEHIHIIASRIRMDGSVVSDSWDYRRSEVVVRQLEKEFALEAAPCSNERVATRVREEHGIETTVSDRRALTRKQKHHNSGKPPVKQRLADLIDEVTRDNPTVTQLIARLQHFCVKVHPSFSTKGLFKEAIAFELDGVKVAGNKLGSAYSFPGLRRKRGVDYDPERDNRALQAAAAGEVVQLPLEEATVTIDPIQQQLALQIGETPVQLYNYVILSQPENILRSSNSIKVTGNNYELVMSQEADGSKTLSIWDKGDRGELIRLRRSSNEKNIEFELAQKLTPQDASNWEKIRQWLNDLLAQEAKSTPKAQPKPKPLER